ncbi:MAG TPA: hypothetical protein VGX26_08820 [Solirubrobacteraceae bacterium]|jgi:hypothetical protein|nr:hypothetical protein [Solirubrobacteraceae bacterium]
MPTTVGRKAVQTFHESGAAAARTYLGDKLEDWLGHTNPSMRGNATNTLRALDTYISAHALDGRAFVGHGANVVLSLPSGSVKTRVDVVMTRERELSGRAVFWDGDPITLNEAPVIAYPYAVALQRLYPDETITDICVWQVRRGNLFVVPVMEALAEVFEHVQRFVSIGDHVGDGLSGGANNLIGLSHLLLLSIASEHGCALRLLSLVRALLNLPHEFTQARWISRALDQFSFHVAYEHPV